MDIIRYNLSKIEQQTNIGKKMAQNGIFKISKIKGII